MGTRLLHLRQVISRTSLSRTSIYRLQALGEFPKSIALGARVAWVESEVESWVQARIDSHRKVA